MDNEVRMCHSEKTKQTLLLDLCNVLGRNSWLSAIPTVPDTWLTLGLEKRDSQGLCAQSECTWNTNSSVHSCAGTTSLLVLSHKARIHCRDTRTKPSAPSCVCIRFFQRSKTWNKTKKSYCMYTILAHLGTCANWTDSEARRFFLRSIMEFCFLSHFFTNFTKSCFGWKAWGTHT